MCATEKALLELTAGLPPVQQSDNMGLPALITSSLDECLTKILESKGPVDPVSLLLWNQLLRSQEREQRALDQLAASTKSIQNLHDRVADLEHKIVQSEITQSDLTTKVQVLQQEAGTAAQHAHARQVELETELAKANNAVKLTRDQIELTTFERRMEGDSPIDPAVRSVTLGSPDLKQQPSTNMFPLACQEGAEAPVELRFAQISVQPPAPSDRDLDKIARNIPRFEPELEGSNNVHHYLSDINFYLRRFPKATVDDKIYLIKATSSRDVGCFIQRQLPQVKRDYSALCKALEEDFSNHLAQTGLIVALAIKQ